MTLLNADRWLYTKLTTDAALLAALGGRVYSETAPAGTAYPLALIQAVSSVPDTNASAERIMDSELWQVKVVGNNPSYNGLESIADQIRAALHRASGTGVVGCVFEQALRMEEIADGMIYKTILMEFRIWTQ